VYKCGWCGAFCKKDGTIVQMSNFELAVYENSNEEEEKLTCDACDFDLMLDYESEKREP